MNKLTKVGCSALCGSLAAISAAYAGDLTVTGGADMTWMSKQYDTTGNPLGVGSNSTLNGSGELDNGWTFDVAIANTNLQAYSATTVNLTMGGVGKLTLDQGSSANGIQAFDNVMPTAWEEASGAGLSGGIRGLVSGSGTSQNIMYTSPTGLGSTLTLTWAPDIGATDISDKTTGHSADGNGAGYDVTIKINPSLGTELLSGLNLYAGAHTAERKNNNSGKEEPWQAVGAITYSLGPVSLGHMWSAEDSGDNTTTVWRSYKLHGYGLSFNINDDLSVSYGKLDSRKTGYNHSATQTGAPGDRRITVESYQIAYTMGGASIRLADVTVDNAAFSAGNTKEATVLSLGLAF